MNYVYYLRTMQNDKIEQLKKEIAKLEAKYQVTATRNAYKIGEQLRAKQTELNNLLNK